MEVPTNYAARHLVYLRPRPGVRATTLQIYVTHKLEKN